jgi:hypothetical protein
MNGHLNILSPHVLYRLAWGFAAVSGGLTVIAAYLSGIPWVARSAAPIGLVLTLIGIGCAWALLGRSRPIGSAPSTHHLALGANVIFFFGFVLSIIAA